MMIPPIFILWAKQWLARKILRSVVSTVTKQGVKMKGSRTIIVNVAALIASVLAYYGFSISPEVLVPILAAGLPVVNVWLRSITSTGIFQKG